MPEPEKSRSEREGSRDARDARDSRRRSKSRERKRSKRDHSKSRDTRDKDRDTRDKDRDTRDKDRDTRDKDRDTRDKDRDTRDKDRDRDRDKDRDRDRYRDRDRSRDRRRRDDSRDRRRRSSSRDKKRERDREREKNKDKSSAPENENSSRAPTLKDIIAANPGISVTEALQRLQAINMANEMSGGALLGLNPSAALQMASNITGGYNINSTGNKLAREVYIGNLPPDTQIPALTEFINSSLRQLGHNNPLGSVVTAWVSTDGHYAFIEFRTVEEATAALNHLGGVNYMGLPLRIGRPKTPGPGGGSSSSGTALVTGVPLGIGSFSDPVLASNLVIRTADLKESKVFMLSNLPDEVDVSQLLELASPFGEITRHNLIPTPRSIIIEYTDTSSAESAVAALHQMFLCDRKITSHRVPITMSPVLLQNKENKDNNIAPEATSPEATTAFTVDSTASALCDEADANTTSSACAGPISAVPTTVLRLDNMISTDELTSEDSYATTLEDIADEINKATTIIDIQIPKPPGILSATEASVVLATHANGIGYVFVKFATPDAAASARKAVEHRNFGGKRVAAVFYNPQMYDKKQWSETQ